MSGRAGELRSTLGRVRGLGSAKEGVAHWWAQRLTAVALVPLTIWFVASVVVLIGAGHGAVASWLARPVPAVLLLLLIAATFHHAQLGLQVVIEDYVAHEGARIALVVLVKGLAALLAALSGFAVLKLALGG